MDDPTDDLQPCPVAMLARHDPARSAVETSQRTISYGELDRLVHRMAVRLDSLGIGSGSTIATDLPADWRTPIILWALLRSGGCLVPLNSREPLQRLRQLAAAVKADVVLSDDRMIDDNERGALGITSRRWSDLADPHIDETGSSEPDHGPPEIAALDLSCRATIVFTSGSAGNAKGVEHALRAHWFSALGSQERIPVDAETRWLALLPFYHVGGLSILFRCFMHGGCVVLAGIQSPGDAIRSTTPTHTSVVATQLLRLLEGGAAPALARLRHVLVGGSRVPDGLIRRAHAAGIPIHKTYGLTEMASQVTTTRQGASLGELGTSGEVLPFREVRITDDGEIAVRGPTLFNGYIEPGGLKRPFDPDGWFATGDTGRLDEEGRLIVTGRTDSMFVSGGENIHPEEVEEAIIATGLTDRAVVVPVDDEEFGSRPVAFVSPFPDEERLRSRLSEHLPGFKIPDRFLELPEDDALKPDRNRLARIASRTPP